MELRKKRKSTPNIPTASMGDIAFLIIIFFMTSTVFTREKGIKMLLPEKSREITKVKPENVVSILINPEGALKLKAPGYDGIDISPQQYSEVKRIVEEKLLERDTLLVVSLKTSRDARYQAMIEVLDQIKLARVVTQDGRELRANKISLVPTSEE
jgi:biopolymer transport protein ExbD|uniref:Biopolymer transporter ExbD n=1 Tax=candidate division WOR-3 bacterium TaxID=2052148 RepID=A0A7V3RG96_UNCW3